MMTVIVSVLVCLLVCSPSDGLFKKLHVRFFRRGMLSDKETNN